MFESADLDHACDKTSWKREEPLIRQKLIEAQFALGKQKPCSVLIIVGGVDGAGKGETVHLLNEWMDPRHIQTYAFSSPSDEERDRPDMWRYWRVLPPRGKIGIFYGSWYTSPILSRVNDNQGDDALGTQLQKIRRHEEMLSAEGVLLLKFWFHLSRDQQRKRLKRLEKDPDTRWRVTREDWRRFKLYDEFRKVSEQSLRITSTGKAPWTIVPGFDHRYRSLMVGRLLLEALQTKLAAQSAAAKPSRKQEKHIVGSAELLQRMDLSKKLAPKHYADQLEKCQGELNLLCRSKKFRARSLVCVFEGGDAAGKGSAIRRIAGALDARYYKIVPVAAPTEEERAHPYLWRFWRQLPRRGQVLIFDRSWYGRVLVERVEGFCSREDWTRAYGEINDFEEQLVQSGSVVSKFWLQISADEQKRRFEDRQKTPFKRFKITDEDWRNRENRELYEVAVSDMVDRCSTEYAPWTLVEAEDKRFARIKILKTLIQQVRSALD